MTTVRVKLNVWGNYGLFVGAQKFCDTGEEFVAKEWLSDMLTFDYNTLSPKSDITMKDIEEFRAAMARPIRRIVK